jgi:hypothetical protein
VFVLPGKRQRFECQHRRCAGRHVHECASLHWVALLRQAEPGKRNVSRPVF